MPRSIESRNFKCFENMELALAPLTLLCGLNGMGKSSIIQAMLALRQSFVSGELRDGHLVLGGELTDLGTGQDVLCEDAEVDMVEFEFHGDDSTTPCRLSFDYSRTADELTTRNNFAAAWREAPPLGGQLVYVNAGCPARSAGWTRRATGSSRRWGRSRRRRSGCRAGRTSAASPPAGSCAMRRASFGGLARPAPSHRLPRPARPSCVPRTAPKTPRRTCLMGGRWMDMLGRTLY